MAEAESKTFWHSYEIPNVPDNIAQGLYDNDSLQATNITAIQECSYKGGGQTVTVIDCTPEEHGFGIATIIKALLPEARVQIAPIKTDTDILWALKQAQIDGVDAVNMSFGLTKQEVETYNAFLLQQALKGSTVGPNGPEKTEIDPKRAAEEYWKNKAQASTLAAVRAALP